MQFLDGFRSQPSFFADARKNPGAVEPACKAIELGVDVECVDQLQQTPLSFAAREGNMVAKMLISLGMTINFVDNNGKMALDYAVVNDRFEMVRLLTSMGAHINSASLSKSQAMEALRKEVRDKNAERRESRQRKRDADSTKLARIASGHPGKLPFTRCPACACESLCMLRYRPAHLQKRWER